LWLNASSVGDSSSIVQAASSSVTTWHGCLLRHSHDQEISNLEKVIQVLKLNQAHDSAEPRRACIEFVRANYVPVQHQSKFGLSQYGSGSGNQRAMDVARQ
jgi:hypothetical protein